MHPRILLLLVLSSPALAAPIVPEAPPPEMAAENAAERQSLFDVEIENRVGGAIVARLPGGSVKRLGRVRRPARAAEPVPGAFHASYYVKPGIVCATAVNALHVKAGPRAVYDPRRPTANPAVNFNLAPEEVAPRAASPPELFEIPGERAPDELPVLSRGSDHTVFTDIPGGTGMFGGVYAPFTGTPVDVMASGAWVPLELFAGADGTRPLPGLLRLRVSEPLRRPLAIELENREGGAVRIVYAGEPPRVIAAVRKRVRGTGNFEGGQYAGVGQLRAAHPGVICVSTSPRGKLGGFQIVPANHARYMRYPENPRAYQWLVVASVAGAGAPAWPGYTDQYLDAQGRLNFRPAVEGMAPVFANFLRGDLRLMVQRQGEAASGPCPEIVGKTEPGLGVGSPVDGFEALRLELPGSALEAVAADLEWDPRGLSAGRAAAGAHLAPRDAAGRAAARRIRHLSVPGRQ